MRLSPPWRWVWAYVLPERRERLRLTFAGGTLCAVAVALAAAAYNNASNILFLALSLTLAMFGLSGALAWLNFWKLRWGVTAPERGRAGEPAIARLVIRNTRLAVPAYAVRILWGVAGEPESPPVRLGAPLAAGESRDLAVVFTPARRGVVAIRVEGAMSSHPFALVHKRQLRSAEASMLVLPARIAYDFEDASGRRLHREGDRQRRGPGAELLGLRDYRTGDAPRVIHWKSSAKRGRLLVRETSEPGESGYAVWLDAGDFVDAPAAWEKAVSCAASLAEDLFAAGRLSAAGIAPGGLAPMRRAHEVQAFLRSLAGCPEIPVAGGAAGPAVRLPVETLRLVPGPGDVVHVTLGTEIVGEA